MVVIGKRRGLARLAQRHSRPAAAPGSPSKVARQLLRGVRLAGPGDELVRLAATVNRQTPRSPSDSHSCTSALRSVTAASAFWISSTVSGLEQRRVGRAAAGELLRLAEAREQRRSPVIATTR